MYLDLLLSLPERDLDTKETKSCSIRCIAQPPQCFLSSCRLSARFFCITDYNTILLHAEKISNGQHDFAPVLRRELHEKLNIADTESLISDLMTNKDIEFLNRVRQFLSQFPFEVVGDDGEHYQLVKHGNFCELDVVEQPIEPVVDDKPTREPEGDDSATELIELPIESSQPVTLEIRAERIRRLQADVQRGIIEIGFELIAAKKEIGHGGWTDWLEKEFEWTDRTARNFMAIAERFGNRKSISDLTTTTLIKMLALPEGDEEAFIEAQAQAGSPVETQSARQVQQAVKQWKETKSKEVSATEDNELSLFAVEDEVAEQIQSVGESEEDIIIESESMPIQNSESNLTPTEDSDESVDVVSDESIQSFADEENLRVELEKKRAETQKLLDEISTLIQTVADTKLDESIRELKSIRDGLNTSC